MEFEKGKEDTGGGGEDVGEDGDVEDEDESIYVVGAGGGRYESDEDLVGFSISVSGLEFESGADRGT